MHGVLDAVLSLLHLDLGRTADAEYRDTAGELGQSLLQFLPVVVRGSFIDLRLDLGNTRLNIGLLARATEDHTAIAVWGQAADAKNFALVNAFIMTVLHGVSDSGT
jgi:hypothetical protein